MVSINTIESADTVLSEYSQSLGAVIENLMQEEEVCNLKVILLCAQDDSVS